MMNRIEQPILSETESHARGDAAEELFELAARVEAWRVGRGLSSAQLYRTIGGLNDKTHKKLLAKDLTELRAENHVAKYRAALAEIEMFDRRQEAEETLPDLPPTESVLLALRTLKLNRGNDRFVLIEGESGAGKTTALKHAAEKIADAVYVSAHESWTQRPSLALGELLEAAGARGGLKEGFAARHGDLVARLRERPRLLIIDEGQHMEVRMLNVIKDIINRTPCWVALGTMSSLWKKIQSARWSEVKQLLHNRMHCRVIMPRPDAAAAEAYLSARLAFEAPAEKTEEARRWQRAFDTIAAYARSHGLYAYLRKVAAAARLAMLQDGRKNVTPDDLLQAAAAVAANTEGFQR